MLCLVKRKSSISPTVFSQMPRGVGLFSPLGVTKNFAQYQLNSIHVLAPKGLALKIKRKCIAFCDF